MKSNISLKRNKFLRLPTSQQDSSYRTQEYLTIKQQQNEAFINLVQLSSNICSDDTLQPRKFKAQKVKQSLYSPWRCFQKNKITPIKKNNIENSQKNQLLNNKMLIQKLKSKHNSTLLKYLSSQNKQNKQNFFKTQQQTQNSLEEHRINEFYSKYDLQNDLKEDDFQKYTCSQFLNNQQQQVLHFSRNKLRQESQIGNSKIQSSNRHVSFPKCVSIQCTPLKKRQGSQSQYRKTQKLQQMTLFWKKQAHTRVCSKKRKDLRAKKQIGYYGTSSEKNIKKTATKTNQNFYQINSSNPISRILLQKYFYVLNNQSIQ